MFLIFAMYIVYVCDFTLHFEWYIIINYIQGIPKKNALSECCWSHSALAQLQVAGTPCVWKLTFWSFLTKTKPDQALSSHVNSKIWPHST